MRLKPSCSWCKDYSKFIENIQLRILLQCYKRLAIYIKRSEILKKWAALQTGNTPGVLISSANSVYNQNNCPSNFKDLIDEGSNLQDKYTFFEPPSLKNLNKSTSLTATASSNSTSLDSLDHKLVQTSNLATISNVKINSLDKKDDLIKSSTIVRLTANDNSIGSSNQLINNSLHNHHNHLTNQTNSSSSLNNPLNSINQSMNASAAVLTPTKSKQHKVRKGCRCGLATLNPGKLTCCGQRCPCYVEGKACFECKCRGCRNPNKTTTNSEKQLIKNNLIANRTSPILITTSSINNLTTNQTSLISTSPNLFTSTSNLQLNNNLNQTTLLSTGTRNLLSPNIFPTGTKFSISTTSPANIFQLGHNNVGNVSVDSLTLPFPTIECIEEDTSLHQIT